MRDINDRDVRMDFQNHTLQRADQMVVRSVIRRQRNNRVGQWSLSAWAFCDVARVTPKSHLFTLMEHSARVKNPAHHCCAIANELTRHRNRLNMLSGPQPWRAAAESWPSSSRCEHAAFPPPISQVQWPQSGRRTMAV